MKDIFPIMKILLKTGAAALFGAAYWLFLEYIQPQIVNNIYNCNFCERCANILYDKEQPVLAMCAGLAFFIVAVLNIRGFKGVLKTIAVSFLCFQVYSMMTAMSVIRSEECTALHRTRAPFILPLIILGIDLLIKSSIWAGICAAPLLIFNFARSIMAADSEEVQSLDIDLE